MVLSKTAELWITIATSVGVLAIVAASYHFLTPRTRGRSWKPHVFFWGIGIALIAFVPASISKYVFSPLAVTMVGTLFPIYESGTCVFLSTFALNLTCVCAVRA
jgi:hypothetical protein